jgi:hypothetical protein
VLVVELNACLDPLARGGRGGLGEAQEKTGLVVLVGVGCAEGKGCGDEVRKRRDGMRTERSCVS